jgi:hypothetical protein
MTKACGLVMLISVRGLAPHRLLAGPLNVTARFHEPIVKQKF